MNSVQQPSPSKSDILNQVRAKQLAGGQPNPAPPASKGSFWSRHSTIINFWLDAVLAVLFLVQAWIFAVLRLVFPRGAGPDWKLLGLTPLDWSETLFNVFCVFSLGVVVHVMFHWKWICGVISTRFLGRKAEKDDGTQTLLGVCLLAALVHLLIGGILLAKLALTGPK